MCFTQLEMGEILFTLFILVEKYFSLIMFSALAIYLWRDKTFSLFGYGIRRSTHPFLVWPIFIFACLISLLGFYVIFFVNSPSVEKAADEISAEASSIEVNSSQE